MESSLSQLEALKASLADPGCTHILILDDAGGPSVNTKTIYSNFLKSEIEAQAVRLFIITSLNGLSDQDKKSCTYYAEIDDPNKNAQLEIKALEMHRKYRIDRIYTKQEDLILRAAHLRRLFGCKIGLHPDDALVFRDKEVMKKIAMQKGGIPVPFFTRVRTPADILGFVQQHGYPIIVKPTLGSSSAGLRVIKDQRDCQEYLINEFFGDEVNDNAGRHDHSGTMMAEVFLSKKMYHINGYAKDGKIIYVWPFQYVSTNFDFTQGNAYGNVFITKTDTRWSRLLDFSQRLCDCLPKTQDLFFHIEVFEKDTDKCFNADADFDYALCELAARRPGGSIGLLMDQVEGGKGLFQEIEFRLSCGQGLKTPISESVINDINRKSEKDDCCGDLLVPLRKGVLLSLPPKDAQPPQPHIKYVPIASPGREYHGFDVLKMNTCCRFVATGLKNADEAEKELNGALAWFNENVKYGPLTEKEGTEQVDSGLGSSSISK